MVVSVAPYGKGLLKGAIEAFGAVGRSADGVMGVARAVSRVDNAAAVGNNAAGAAQKSNLPGAVFHYTSENTAELIERSQLGFPGRITYLTPNGQLTPLQSQIELALPQKNTGKALFEITTRGLDPSKLLLQQRVPGNVFNRGGGGVEILYEGPIPLENVRRVR